VLAARRRPDRLARWRPWPACLSGVQLLVALLALMLLAVGCSTVGPRPPAGQRPQSLPPHCTHTITQAGEVSGILAAVSAGDTVCFSGTDLADAEVALTRSGNPAAPITLVANGASVRSVQINADYVIVEGFTVTNGDGVLLKGNGITARNNTIHDTERGGIMCDPCTEATLESNTISHVATVGIWISGQRAAVHANTIGETFADHSDADGIRFFGIGHRITDNTITDISARGYGTPPHPDCFQTYDENGPPTSDVVISGNTCRNVDAQCLIATGDQSGNSGAPSDSPSIIFKNNLCANNGFQAVNLRRWPNVQIIDNRFTGPNMTRAVLIIDGSTGTTVVGNTTIDGVPLVDIDHSSRPGSHIDGGTR
jgi:hypothetical protein